MQVIGDAAVDDQVVDHAAGRIVAAECVLRLPGTDAVQIVAEAGVDEVLRTRTAHHGVAEMAYVEDTNGFPHGKMLLDHARVLDRHLPPAELRHPRTQREM